MSALSLAQITLDLMAVSAVVAALVSQFIQPIISHAPALSASAPDQTLRNAVLRLANVLLSIIGVLALAGTQGMLNTSNLIPTAAAILAVALGAHTAYKVIPAPAATTVTLLPGTLMTAPAAAPAAAQPTPAQIAAAGMIIQPAVISVSPTPSTTSGAPATVNTTVS